MACRMKLWSARDTADEDGQQGGGIHNTPTVVDAQAANNIIPQLLLDGRQGKLITSDHPHGVARPYTGRVNRVEDEGELGKEGKTDESNKTGSTDTARKDVHPTNQSD